jgi:hypothetical protein
MSSCDIFLIAFLWILAMALTIIRRLYLISKRAQQSAQQLNKLVHEQKIKKAKSQKGKEADQKGDNIR